MIQADHALGVSPDLPDADAPIRLSAGDWAHARSAAPALPAAPTVGALAMTVPQAPMRRLENGVQVARVARGIVDVQALAALRPLSRPGANPAPEAEATVDLAVLRPVQRPARVVLAQAAPAPAPAQRPASIVEVARAETAEEVPQITPARFVAEPIQTLRRGSNPCSSRLTREIPRRARSAPSGSTFIAALNEVGGGSRDAAIADEILRGNVPSFLRDLQPVSFTGVTGTGTQTEITICVTPDYLALGSDDDNVRVPLGLEAAARIAGSFDMMLPTTRMVDAIYAQADLRLTPQPMTPGSQMSSTAYFTRHNATVEAQFSAAGGRNGMLVSGHKKDLVLTNRLARSPGRVAIYGWHQPGGRPIQPLSTVHGASYADYSHGIRLVSTTAYVNGRAVDLTSLLSDGRYAGILNSEGPITAPAIRLAALR